MDPDSRPEHRKRVKGPKIYSLWHAITEIKLMGGNAEEGEALWHNRVWWRGLVFLLDSEGSSAQLPEEGSTHLTDALLYCALFHTGVLLSSWNSSLFGTNHHLSGAREEEHFVLIPTSRLYSRYPFRVLGYFPPQLFFKFPHRDLHSSRQKVDQLLPRRRRWPAEAGRRAGQFGKRRLGKRTTKFSQLSGRV